MHKYKRKERKTNHSRSMMILMNGDNMKW